MSLVLPSLEKSWIFGSSLGVSNFLNQATPTVGYLHSSGFSQGSSAPTNAAGDAQNTWYKLVNSLVNIYGGNAWQLVANSYYPGSGTTMATSNSVNGFANGIAIQWNSAGSAHSWIILKQPAMQGGGPAMLCIDFAGVSSTCSVGVYFSPGGLYPNTGLSFLNRPTATDEITLMSLTTLSNTNIVGSALHVMQSLDGFSTRAFMLQSGAIVFSMFLESIVPDGSSNLAYKMACLAQNTATPGSGWSISQIFWCRVNGITAPNFQAYGAVECSSNIAVPLANGGAISDFTGGYPISPIGLVSQTIGARGKVGRFVDLWLGSSAVPSMATYPLSGGKNFIQVGNFVVPWDGATVPIINA